jgi:hypothetical protein
VEFGFLVKQYGVTKVTGDRYAGEWPVQAWKRQGISYETSDLSASESILPVIDSIAKAQKVYETELTELRKKLAGPVFEASELQIAEVRSKLAGPPATMRFTKISQSIDKGSDLLVAATLSCDSFLSDFLSEAEKSVILEKWQRARMPESDSEHLERTGRLLENWQRSCFNSSISARDIIQARPNQRGAPGPVHLLRICLCLDSYWTNIGRD